jgi:RNA polymerase sigma-70 factor (ECF subfamily)
MITVMSAADEDHRLIVAARSGDSIAREALGRRVSRSAYLFAFQLTGDREASRDIAQDGALRFFRHLDRFDPARPIEPWLYQIVRNRVRDLARRAQIRRHESLDAWLEHRRPEPAAAAHDPAGEAERADLRQRIWQSVAHLSDPHREIFLLRDFHDLSYGEIAEVLSIPLGTVMSRLHAARMNLRALLVDDERRSGREGSGR